MCKMSLRLSVRQLEGGQNTLLGAHPHILIASVPLSEVMFNSLIKSCRNMPSLY